MTEFPEILLEKAHKIAEANLKLLIFMTDLRKDYDLSVTNTLSILTNRQAEYLRMCSKQEEREFLKAEGFEYDD